VGRQKLQSGYNLLQMKSKLANGVTIRVFINALSVLPSYFVLLVQYQKINDLSYEFHS